MNKIQNPPDYFDELSSLHDARIIDVRFDKVENTLFLRVDDINSGFLGLPEYAGEQAATFRFDMCSKEVLEFESPNIYSLRCVPGHALSVFIDTWPSGKVEFLCGSVSVERGG